MDADKKLAVERDNAKLGRGLFYLLAIGMGIAFLLSWKVFEWPIWAQVVTTIFGGPVLALVLYLPLSFFMSVFGFAGKSFIPKSK
jgi:hypothetical protein